MFCRIRLPPLCPSRLTSSSWLRLDSWALLPSFLPGLPSFSTLLTVWVPLLIRRGAFSLIGLGLFASIRSNSLGGLLISWPRLLTLTLTESWSRLMLPPLASRSLAVIVSCACGLVKVSLRLLFGWVLLALLTSLFRVVRVICFSTPSLLLTLKCPQCSWPWLLLVLALICFLLSRMRHFGS